MDMEEILCYSRQQEKEGMADQIRIQALLGVQEGRQQLNTRSHRAALALISRP